MNMEPEFNTVASQRCSAVQGFLLLLLLLSLIPYSSHPKTSSFCAFASATVYYFIYSLLRSSQSRN